MNRLGLAAAILLPVTIAACHRNEPEPVAVPIMSGAEQACATRAAETTGADASTVTVVPTASTKTGESIYTVTANGVNYNCVVGPDLTVSSFTAQ